MKQQQGERGRERWRHEHQRPDFTPGQGQRPGPGSSAWAPADETFAGQAPALVPRQPLANSREHQPLDSRRAWLHPALHSAVQQPPVAAVALLVALAACPHRGQRHVKTLVDEVYVQRLRAIAGDRQPRSERVAPGVPSRGIASSSSLQKAQKVVKAGRQHNKTQTCLPDGAGLLQHIPEAFAH